MILVDKNNVKNIEWLSKLYFGYDQKILSNDPLIMYDLINKSKRKTSKEEIEIFGISKNGTIIKR